MRHEFKLPDIGEGVAEGEILKWMVAEGQKIAEDQPLVEVMTDKVNVQIPSPKGGVVSKILAKEGETVRVGTVIVVIEAEGEDGGAPRSVTAATQARVDTSRVETAPVAPAPVGGGRAESVLATPATRRLARELGVDITEVTGSGPMGRITEEDVRKAGAEVEAPVATQHSVHSDADERVPLRGVRKLVAEHMSKSIHTTAQVTHVDEADLTELVALRESLKERAEKAGVKLTYLPLIVKAVAQCLREFPYVNSTLDEQAGEIVLRKSYNIGIAMDTENGLVVPVVRDADKKDVLQIAAEIQQLAAKAREGRLSLEEVHGSTFTVTNQGSVGGLFATPIINYPEAAILGTHRVTKRPVVRDGKVEVRDVMFLSLSFDHRVFDGAYAARFVNRVIEVAQDPKRLLSQTG